MYQRIIFFGSGEYIIPIVEKIRKKGLEFVVTSEHEEKDKPTPPLITYLKEENIPYLSSNLSNPDDIERLKLYAPTLGVLASYGAVIKPRVIDMFIYGIFNIHPSLLPKYKGPSPIQAAILSGDNKIGVSIIRLDNQIDHGPILDQKEIELDGAENYLDLRKKLFEMGAEMIALKLEELREKDHLLETPQEETSDPYTKKITRSDGQIDLSNPPSPEIIERMIRAYYPWPGVFVKTILTGTEKIIKLLPDGKIQVERAQSRTSEMRPLTSGVQTSEDTLEKKQPFKSNSGILIQVEGKRSMTIKDFANGYQSEGREILSKLSLAF